MRRVIVAIIAIVLVLVGSVTVERMNARRATPPKRVVSYRTYLEWRPTTDQYYLVPAPLPSGPPSAFPPIHDHLVALSPIRGILASGPAAYVFGPSGDLIDWTSDLGDDPAFRKRWSIAGPPRNYNREILETIWLNED